MDPKSYGFGILTGLAIVAIVSLAPKALDALAAATGAGSETATSLPEIGNTPHPYHPPCWHDDWSEVVDLSPAGVLSIYEEPKPCTPEDRERQLAALAEQKQAVERAAAEMEKAAAIMRVERPGIDHLDQATADLKRLQEEATVDR